MTEFELATISYKNEMLGLRYLGNWIAASVGFGQIVSIWIGFWLMWRTTDQRRAADGQRHAEAMDIADKRHAEAMEFADKRHDEAMEFAGKRHDEAMEIAGKRHEEAMEIAGKRHEEAMEIAGKRHEEAMAGADQRHAESMAAIREQGEALRTLIRGMEAVLERTAPRGDSR